MKTLIYSDVHGNLPAFEAVLKHAGSCDQYICLGDLVNYGPWGNECVELALSLPNSILLLGNHEQAFIDGRYPGENPLVTSFFNMTYGKFDRIKEITSFLEEFTFYDYTCKHTLDNDRIYPDTNIHLNKNYIIGHSHHQFLYCNNNLKLYNAGSVGQNRKDIRYADFLIHDSLERNRITMFSIEYNVNHVISKMKALNYPKACINYYTNKLRV